MSAMIQFSERLPIDDALPALTAALRQSHAAVLVAPPGAGKTTRVPLVLIDEPWAAGQENPGAGAAPARRARGRRAHGGDA